VGGWTSQKDEHTEIWGAEVPACARRYVGSTIAPIAHEVGRAGVMAREGSRKKGGTTLTSIVVDESGGRMNFKSFSGILFCWVQIHLMGEENVSQGPSPRLNQPTNSKRPADSQNL
jgi:hypothetical protein